MKNATLIEKEKNQELKQLSQEFQKIKQKAEKLTYFQNMLLRVYDVVNVVNVIIIVFLYFNVFYFLYLNVFFILLIFVFLSVYVFIHLSYKKRKFEYFDFTEKVEIAYKSNEKRFSIDEYVSFMDNFFYYQKKIFDLNIKFASSLFLALCGIYLLINQTKDFSALKEKSKKIILENPNSKNKSIRELKLLLDSLDKK